MAPHFPLHLVYGAPINSGNLEVLNEIAGELK
jgi:hypothetical protein